MLATNRCLTVIALAALAAAGCRSRSDSAENPRVLAVRTARAEQRTIDDTLQLTGTLRPRAQVTVVSEVAARLMQIVKDSGARAQKGDVLAVLDDTDYRLTLDRANAALEVAEANREHAVVEKERADNLLKTGGITDKDHLAVQVGLRVAAAALSQVRAETAIAEKQHARCQVRAPFTGRVADRFPDPGTLLGAGTPIFTFVDDSMLEFRGTLPSVDFGRVRVGDPAFIEVDAVSVMKVDGRVARVTPLVDERTRTFEIAIEVAGNKDLAGGLFARARIRMDRIKDAVVVPPESLLRDGALPERAEIFVVENDKAQRKSVLLGVEQAEYIQVKQGLAAGQIVVLDPPTSLTSGVQVETRNGRAR